jgi:hypothetical protein
MMSEWINLVPGSPLSPPSWRWQLATWLATTGRALPKCYRDAWVARAHRYLAARRDCRRDPAVRHAAALYFDATHLRRAHFEAYLLTGEPLAVVAGRCDVSVPTAEAYAQLFFDVSRKARDKVALLIGPGLAAGFGRQDVGRLWRAFGYYSGLMALDAAVAVSIEDGLVEGPADLPHTAPPVTDKRLRESVRLALGAMMLPADTPPGLLAELHAQARRIASRPRVRSVPDTLAAADDSLLESADAEVLVPPRDTAVRSVA